MGFDVARIDHERRKIGPLARQSFEHTRKNTRLGRLCCTNGVGDSLFESSGVAMFYEQLVPYDVQDQELAFVQHGAEAARFAIDLV